MMTTVKQLPTQDDWHRPEWQDEVCSGQSAKRDCLYCNGPETD